MYSSQNSSWMSFQKLIQRFQRDIFSSLPKKKSPRNYYIICFSETSEEMPVEISPRILSENLPRSSLVMPPGMFSYISLGILLDKLLRITSEMFPSATLSGIHKIIPPKFQKFLQQFLQRFSRNFSYDFFRQSSMNSFPNCFMNLIKNYTMDSFPKLFFFFEIYPEILLF